MRLSLALLLTTSLCHSLNFLVYIPIFGHSHTNYLVNVGEILADAGHNVTFLMPILNRLLVNKTVSRNPMERIMLDMSDEICAQGMATFETLTANSWEQDDLIGLLQLASRMATMFGQMCEETIIREDVLNDLRSRHFDAGIAEPLSVCGLGIFDVLDIPRTIAATSTPPMDTVSRLIGQPTAPSYVPAGMSTTGDRMSISQRLANTLHSHLVIFNFGSIYYEEQRLLYKHYPEKIRSVEDMMASVSFQLINTNPLIDFPFPTIQKNVAVGGMQVDLDELNREKVDEKWDKILSERPHSVLISFGSVAQSTKMPEAYKNSLLSVFESMPDTTFIWKYEDPSSDIVDHLNNVHIATWIPQKALLGDSRLSLFITHGGLGSTTELAHLGKPAIMIPLFGDQARNSLMLARHGGVKQLTKFDLKEPSVVRNTIEEVVHDPSYLSNATRLARMLRDQPISARELVLKHCEFAAKYGPLPQLDPYGRTLSFVEYFLLDIALILISLLIFSILIARWLVRRCCCRKVKQE